MQAHVGHGRGDEGGRPQRRGEPGLIDVAEAGPAPPEQRDRLLVPPARVAELDDAREVREPVEELLEARLRLRRVMERLRELDQDRPEQPRVEQRRERAAEPVLLRVGIGAGHRPASLPAAPGGSTVRPGPGRFVREQARGLHREPEARVGGHPRGPRRRHRGIGDAVEGDVHFERVEESREHGEGVEPVRPGLRVDDAVPVLVMPACRADPDHPSPGRRLPPIPSAAGPGPRRRRGPATRSAFPTARGGRSGCTAAPTRP